MKKLLWSWLALLMFCFSINISAQQISSAEVLWKETQNLPTKSNAINKKGQRGSHIREGNLFYDDFSSGNLEAWTESDDGKGSFSIYDNNTAGGEAPQLLFYPSWGESITKECYLMSPVFTTKDAKKLAFTWKSYGYAYGAYNFEIRTTSDGGETWNVGYSKSYAAGSYAESNPKILINTDDIGSETFQFALVFVGTGTLGGSFVYLDDIEVISPFNKDIALNGLAKFNKAVYGTEKPTGLSLTNAGSDTVTVNAMMVAYDQDNQVVYSDSKEITVNPFASAVADLKNISGIEPGEYKLSLITSLVGEDDENPENNQVSSTLYIETVKEKAYAYLPFNSTEYGAGSAIINLEDGTTYPWETGSMTSGNIIYGADFDAEGKWIATGGNVLYTIDTVTGTPTEKAQLQNSYAGIAYSFAHGALFANAYDALYTINLHTGEESLVGAYTNSESMLSVALGNNNTLYGIDKTNLYSIDAETGEATAIGAHGYTLYYGNSLTFDAKKETLYLFGYSYNGAAYEIPMATLDLSTGEATLIKMLSSATTGSAVKPTTNPSNLWTLSGTVKNSNDELIEDARIHIYNSASFSSSALTDADGNYSFLQHLPEGNYKIYAEAKYYQATAETDVNLTENTTHDFTLSLSPNSVTFNIFDHTETNLDSVSVIFYGDTLFTGTGNNVATFEHIPDGTYPASFYRKGYYMQSAEVTVDGANVSENITMYINNDVQRRFVVLEDATGFWCANCPGAARGIKQLLDEGKPIIGLAQHGGDSLEITASRERINYYGITGFPTVVIDGTESVVGGGYGSNMYSYYIDIVNNQINTKTPVDVEIIDSSYNMETRELYVKAKITAYGLVLGNDNSVHFAFTESHLPIIWQGMTEANEVVRYMDNDGKGQAIDLTMGNEKTIEYTYTVPSHVDDKYCHFAVFVQNNGSKEILNADTRKVRNPKTFNLTLNIIDDVTKEKVESGTVLLNNVDLYEFSSDETLSIDDIVEGSITIKIDALGYTSQNIEFELTENKTLDIEMVYKGTEYLYWEDFESASNYNLPDGWSDYNPGASNYIYTSLSENNTTLIFFRQNADNDTMLAISPKLDLSMADSLFFEAAQTGGIPNLSIGYTTSIENATKAEEINEFELSATYETHSYSINGLFSDSVYLVIKFATAGEKMEHLLMDDLRITKVSSNAFLRNITLSTGSLSPEFAYNVFSYNVEVSNDEIPEVTVVTVNNAAGVEITKATKAGEATVIKVTAQDGTIQNYTLNMITGVDNSTAANLNIYPNPVSNTLTIDNLQNANTIELFSIDGKIVQSISVNSASAQIDVENLTNGIYMLQIEFADGSTHRQRISKQ
jgi:hypothetical protein